ncbi:hypothetical protein N431DRAFT_191448 [Stipitochalara longipes BDJ]|nr:hypothetical protein N431DRAFT_191448 [Stipitochalara longipes BDJ]
MFHMMAFSKVINSVWSGILLAVTCDHLVASGGVSGSGVLRLSRILRRGMLSNIAARLKPGCDTATRKKSCFFTPSSTDAIFHSRSITIKI